ncbi:hypothetical protein F4819DRAFT_483841 [Hypoxylon fuscum]|nr:hypothetical protein F4819DRAFT_483841 [Hypoxylon fuscum]
MQPNALLTTLFAVATASGAAIKARAATAFTVSNFTASCIQHSVMCTYEFAVITDPTSASPSGNESPAQCTLMLQGPDYLPPVNLTGCAEKQAYSWAVAVMKEGGLQLNVTTPQDSHANYTGVYNVPADDLVAEQHGAVITQRYTGPSNFEVPIGA